MFQPDSIVIAHLVEPNEKLWGRLRRLDSIGLVMEALNVHTFDDWMYQVIRKKSTSLGLSTVFVPVARIERIYLDQRVGDVESYCERFVRHTGFTVESHLGIGEA